MKIVKKIIKKNKIKIQSGKIIKTNGTKRHVLFTAKIIYSNEKSVVKDVALSSICLFFLYL